MPPFSPCIFTPLYFARYAAASLFSRHAAATPMLLLMMRIFHFHLIRHFRRRC